MQVYRHVHLEAFDLAGTLQGDSFPIGHAQGSLRINVLEIETIGLVLVLIGSDNVPSATGMMIYGDSFLQVVGWKSLDLIPVYSPPHPPAIIHPVRSLNIHHTNVDSQAQASRNIQHD